jgi:hypothetical protein
MLKNIDPTPNHPPASKSTPLTLPDGSTLPSTGRSGAEVPPIKDFGKRVEKGKAEYKAKHGDKMPPVH